MDFEVTPEPTDEEKAAIAAALDLDAEKAEPSPWAQELLPERCEAP